MSITMPAAPGQSCVTWRALHAGLWVARRDGRHLGAVQRGRRWLAADADGEPIGQYRSFAEAQSAVANPAAHRRPLPERSGIGPVLSLSVLAAAALVSASGWFLMALLH